MQKTSDDKFPVAKPEQTVMALVTLCGFLEFNFFAINYERELMNEIRWTREVGLKMG